MPIARIQIGDRIAKIEVPEGTTQEEALAFAQSIEQPEAAPAPVAPVQEVAPEATGPQILTDEMMNAYSAGELDQEQMRDIELGLKDGSLYIPGDFSTPVNEFNKGIPALARPFVSLGRAMASTPESTAKLGVDTAKALTVNLPETATALGGTIVGAVQKLMPGEQEQEKYVDAISQSIVDKYGSIEKAVETFENDPADMLSTLVGFFAPVAGAAGKIAQVAKVPKISAGAKRVAQIASELDPLVLAGKGAASTVRGVLPSTLKVVDDVKAAPEGVDFPETVIGQTVKKRGDFDVKEAEGFRKKLRKAKPGTQSYKNLLDEIDINKDKARIAQEEGFNLSPDIFGENRASKKAIGFLRKQDDELGAKFEDEVLDASRRADDLLEELGAAYDAGSVDTPGISNKIKSKLQATKAKDFDDAEIIYEEISREVPKNSMFKTDNLKKKMDEIYSNVDPEAFERLSPSSKMPDTKIVNPDGTPKTVYQGRSRKGLTSFMNPKGEGWATTDKGTAELFSNISEESPSWKMGEEWIEGYHGVKQKVQGGEVYELNLDIKNPKKVNIKETNWNPSKEAEVIEQAKKEGFDGLEIYHNKDKTDYVAFSPEQIKPAGKTKADLTAREASDFMGLSKEENYLMKLAERGTISYELLNRERAAIGKALAGKKSKHEKGDAAALSGLYGALADDLAQGIEDVGSKKLREGILTANAKYAKAMDLDKKVKKSFGPDEKLDITKDMVKAIKSAGGKNKDTSDFEKLIDLIPEEMQSSIVPEMVLTAMADISRGKRGLTKDLFGFNEYQSLFEGFMNPTVRKKIFKGMDDEVKVLQRLYSISKDITEARAYKEAYNTPAALQKVMNASSLTEKVMENPFVRYSASFGGGPIAVAHEFIRNKSKGAGKNATIKGVEALSSPEGKEAFKEILNKGSLKNITAKKWANSKKFVDFYKTINNKAPGTLAERVVWIQDATKAKPRETEETK